VSTTQTEVEAAPARPRTSPTAWLRDNGVYAALVLLLLFNVVFTANFLTVGNFRTQLIQASPVIVVALGMALVIGTEGVDLSVGAVMALAAAVVPLYLGYGFGVAVLVALLAGLLAGLVNGALVASIGVQPIVATLALFVGGRGLALVLADGQLKTVTDPTFLSLGTGHLLGVPVIVLAAAVVGLVIAFVVRRTTFGRQLVAVGGNRRASELSGLPVKRVLLTTYVISGVLAAVAGILATSRLQASDPSTIGLLFELYAITAVVVGGTPLSGGKVRVLGTIAGALLMQLIDATLVKHNISDSWSQMTQAVIIIAAVYLQLGRGRKG
jgi:ribose/xylose/arabinose/galactoside ABC-type transport system permease subunit